MADGNAKTFDGRSLSPLLQGEGADGLKPVFAELTGEGSEAPAVMVMERRYKYIHCETEPPLLFDRSRDRKEMENLAGREEVADVEARLAAIVAANWNLDELKRSVIESRRRRRVVDRAHAIGRTLSWDHDPSASGKHQYFQPCDANPSASNYNSNFEVRLRPDSDDPNPRDYP